MGRFRARPVSDFETRESRQSFRGIRSTRCSEPATRIPGKSRGNLERFAEGKGARARGREREKREREEQGEEESEWRRRGNGEARKHSRNAVDKVFGRWRRKGQKRQTTQRQPADPPARQGKIYLRFLPRRISRWIPPPPPPPPPPLSLCACQNGVKRVALSEERC